MIEVAQRGHIQSKITASIHISCIYEKVAYGKNIKSGQKSLWKSKLLLSYKCEIGKYNIILVYGMSCISYGKISYNLSTTMEHSRVCMCVSRY